MQTNDKPMSKECAVLRDRALSFVNEGYVIRVMYNTPTLFVSRLVHQYNGNEITITGFPRENWYQQKMNGREVIAHAPIC